MSRNQITRTVALLLLLVFLYLIRGALLPILLGVVLYYILEPLVDRLAGRWPRGAGLNRDLAIMIAFAVLLVLIYLVLQFIIPPFINEFGSLAADSPRYLARARAFYASLQAWEAGWHFPRELNGALSTAFQSTAGYFAVAAQQGANSLLGIVSRIVYLVITPIITFFLLREDSQIARGAIELLPKDQRELAVRVLQEIDAILRNYIVGQGILCSAVGLMCGLGCWLLGVNFALILGIVAAIAQLIPNIGPLIATVPALAVAFGTSPVTALYVLLLYLVINALMISVLGPKVLGGRLNLHPLTVAVSIIVFGELMGVWGFFFAAPIVAIIKVLYLELRNP